MSKSKLATFYIVRHGQTDWNLKGLMQGASDVKLNETGLKQAREITKVLRDIHFDEVISSDLDRAVQTVTMIANEKKLAVTTTKALREKHYGKYEGIPRKEILRELKDLFAQRDKLNDDEKMQFKIYSDGESDLEAVTRFMRHLRELAIASPGKTILIGSHGGIMRYFLIKLGWATYKELDSDAIKNTSYIKVTSDGVDFFIEETFQITKATQK